MTRVHSLVPLPIRRTKGVSSSYHNTFFRCGGGVQEYAVFSLPFPFLSAGSHLVNGGSLMHEKAAPLHSLVI